jgi:hypothetical protein
MVVVGTGAGSGSVVVPDGDPVASSSRTTAVKGAASAAAAAAGTARPSTGAWGAGCAGERAGSDWGDRLVAARAMSAW